MTAVTAAHWQRLRDAAKEASTRAYVPYSRYRVGAAALTDTGQIVTGANVENASYGLTLCAECALVSKLHTDALGSRLVAFACVDAEGSPLQPCGRCRQLLYEFGGDGLLIDGPHGTLTLADLLPWAFGPQHLEQEQAVAHQPAPHQPAPHQPAPRQPAPHQPDHPHRPSEEP